MNLIKNYLLIGLMVSTGLVSAGPASGQNIDVEVSASRENVYLEESLLLTVKVSGADRNTKVDLSAVRNCDITSLGSRSQSYSSISWVNGKRTQTGFQGRIFTYNVTPKKTGRIILGPISVASGNNAVTVKGPAVTVTGMETQDDVIIELTASRDTVLVDERFEITLDIYIKRLPPPHEDTERLLGSRPPHLSVPYLTLAPMDGLDHTDIRTLLQNMITRRESEPSFTLNNYASDRDFFDFDSMFNFNNARRSTPDRFSLPVEKTEMNGQPYWHYRVQTGYVAREERTHTFGPVIFKGNIIESIDQARQVTLKNIFAVGASETVRVIPPPEEGRPESFTGAIGTNMTVDASLDAQNCRVGDPLTLTLSVSGGVNLKNIYPPELTSQTELLKQFRLYEDTLSVNKDGGRVSFSYRIRPTEAGSLEVPPIDLSFFDSASRTYRTVQTQPIPVNAAEAGGIDSAMILGTDTNMLEGMNAEQGASHRYIAPFTTGPGAKENTPPGFTLIHLVLTALAPALFVLSLTVKPVAGIRKKLGNSSKNRSVLRTTARELKRAGKLPPEKASGPIAEAVLSYAGSRFNVKAESLTPPDLTRLLSSSGLSDESVKDLRRIAESHYNASFSNSLPEDADPAADAERAAEIIRQLESLRSKSGSVRLSLLIIAAAVCLASTSFAADDSESDFLWQKAWSQTLSAVSREDYKKTARDYRALAANGIRNKYVFYNMGTALLLAGEKEEAVNALERAELYGGTDERIIHNIKAANAETDELSEGAASWKRIIFFWHFALPLKLRVDIAVAAWVIIFLLLSAAGGRIRKTSRHALTAALAAFVIFGSSVLTSALQEHKARIRDTYMSQQQQQEEREGQ